MFKKNNLIYIFITSFLLATAPDWNCDGDGIFDNIFSYESSGSVTAAVFIDGINAGTSEDDMLGAFVGEELRGIGVATEIVFGPYVGTYQFLTMIFSNQSSGETIEFKFYDAETDAVYDITETYSYVADMTLGNAVKSIHLPNFI